MFVSTFGTGKDSPLKDKTRQVTSFVPVPGKNFKENESFYERLLLSLARDIGAYLPLQVAEGPEDRMAWTRKAGTTSSSARLCRHLSKTCDTLVADGNVI